MGQHVKAMNGVEVPEVRQALTKAEEYAGLASSAPSPDERAYYDRMSRKWLGIADGWRVITEFETLR